MNDETYRLVSIKVNNEIGSFVELAYHLYACIMTLEDGIRSSQPTRALEGSNLASESTRVASEA